MGVIAGTVIGLILGYAWFDQSGEIRSLREGLETSRKRNVGFDASRHSTGLSRGASTSSGRQTHPSDASLTDMNPVAPAKYFADRGITEEDLRVSREMAAKRQDGAYFLRFTDPVRRKVEEAMAVGVAGQFQSNRGAGIRRQFDAKGVDERTQERLLEHQRLIALAGVQAEQYLAQLMEARVDYDRAVRASMSPEDYQSYRQYESAESARAELSQIQSYAQENQIALDDNTLSALLQLVKDQGVDTTKVSDLGPYGGMATPVVGWENGLIEQEQKLARLTGESQALLSAAKAAGLSQDAQRALSGYYGNLVSQCESMLTSLRSYRDQQAAVGQPSRPSP